MPTYPEIRLALLPGGRSHALHRGRSSRDAIHIATEGPLGLAARRHCLRQSAAVHDRLSHALPGVRPCALSAAAGVDLCMAAPVPRAGAGGDVRHAGRSCSGSARGASRNVVHLVARRRHRAVPPGRAKGRPSDRRPVFLYVGRVAVEKNIEAFLAARPAGHEVGGRRRPGAGRAGARGFPTASFLGVKHGADRWPGTTAQADVFVFPSRTDTFGLVLLEAMACGTPVAAFPVTGPHRRRSGSRRGRVVGGSRRGGDGGVAPRPPRRPPVCAWVLVDRGDATVRRQSASDRPDQAVGIGQPRGLLTSARLTTRWTCGFVAANPSRLVDLNST